MKFIVYRTSDGMIQRSGECQDDMLSAQARAGETAIEGEADDVTQYINAGVVTLRPTISATWNKTTVVANGSDTATLSSGLPNPTKVMVQVPDGAVTPAQETVTIGAFSFATPIAGTYTVTVTPPFPYQPHIKVLTAT